MTSKSWMALVGLGGLLLTIALVARFGIIRFGGAAEMKREQEVLRRYPSSFKEINGLRFVVTAPGNGHRPYPGSEVWLRYRCETLEGLPVAQEGGEEGVRRRVGQGPEPRGFHEGLLGMSEGEKRSIILPPHLAYGARGNPPVVPPGATLVYHVDLMRVSPGPP